METFNMMASDVASLANQPLQADIHTSIETPPGDFIYILFIA